MAPEDVAQVVVVVAARPRCLRAQWRSSVKVKEELTFINVASFLITQFRLKEDTWQAGC
jgi:hypothetical protein